MHVFCDESGNTGAALLDPAQPVFSLASTSISGDLAGKLIEPLIRTGQREAKYSKLRGTKPGQRQLIEFFSSAELGPSNCKFTASDKRFYLTCHLVDKLIEPPLHEAGIDLSAREGNINLAKVWHYAGHTIFPRGHWDRVPRSFLDAVRRRDTTSFSQFDDALTRAASVTPPESRDFAVGLLLARGRLPEFLGVYWDQAVLDPAVDAFALLIQRWMDQHAGHFPVTHDASKPLKRLEAFLRALMTPAATRNIGHGNHRGELPLRISTLEFGNSIERPELQVADLIAGAAVDVLLASSGRRAREPYHDDLLRTQLPALYVGGLVPNPKIEQGPETQPGEQSLADGTAEFLSEVGYFEGERK
jgi:Protein of unknown function (DUF3800)